WLKFGGQLARRPWDVARVPNVRNWSRRPIIPLVMREIHNLVAVIPRPGLGEPAPAWIPAAHRAVRLLAEELGGIAGGTWLDLFSIPTTAHFIGGCAIRDHPAP